MTRCELIRCWIIENESTAQKKLYRNKCSFFLEDVIGWEEYVAEEWEDNKKRVWISLGTERTSVFEISYEKFDKLMLEFLNKKEIEDGSVTFTLRPN